MERKHLGYYITKGKCLKVYGKKVLNRRTKRMKVVKVNSKGKAIKKGTKVYKRKADCMKKLKKMMKKVKRTATRKSPKRKTNRTKHAKRTKFGKGCNYSVPYFGEMVPSISKFASGTPQTGFSSSAWKWPSPPGALRYDKQQGGW